MKFSFLLALCAFSIISCIAKPIEENPVLSGDWAVELTHSDIGIARTRLHLESGKNTFEGWSRKGADKDILGGFTSLLGRTFSKGFKGGSLLNLERGIWEKKGGDTIRVAAILVTAMGSYNFDGYVTKDVLFAKLQNSEGYKGKVEGTRQLSKLPLEDYSALSKKAVTLTESQIYNRQILSTKAWKTFVEDMGATAGKVQDDLEMVFAFFYYAGKLPISHYALLKFPPKEDEKADTIQKANVFLTEKTPQTAYLKIASFDGSAGEMDSVFSVILQKNYPNLIVDLRNNAGGSVEAGMAFARYLADTPFYGGIFLTQKYFNETQQLPTVAQYAQFPQFSESNFNLIIEGIHNTKGLCLKVIPAPTTYRGKVFILTNGNTASTCEPIVYGLKQQNRATIIGEKTAGAMLNGEIFSVDKGFSMVIPTADYYAVDGYRIDQKGVLPDKEVKSAEALNVALNMVSK